MNKVVDFHVHLVEYQAMCPSAQAWFAQNFASPQAYQAFRAENSNPANFVRLLTENGVDYAVVLAEVAPLTTGIATNEMVKDFCQGYQQLIPFSTFNPFIDGEMGSKLEDLHLNHGFKGVKLYPTYNHFYPNDRVMYPLYAAAERLSLPIIFHTGTSVFKNSRLKYGNPIFLDDVAVDFPELKIIMAHGGRGPWYNEASTLVRLHANVYIDIAGLPPQKLLVFFPELERFADKFLFGSDWPGADVKGNIARLRQLPLAPAAMDRILGRSALALLGLE